MNNAVFSSSASPASPHRRAPVVTAAHCDFEGAYFGIAFLTQSQNRRAEEEARLAARNSVAPEEHWKGILAYIATNVKGSLVQSFKAERNFEHAEVCFNCSDAGRAAFGADHMVACGTRDTGTDIWPRRFNANYTYRWVSASPDEQRLLYAFFERQRGKPYDQAASLRTFTNPRQSRGRSWYCSELVLAALQLLPCARFHEHRANCVETDDVYRIVCSSPLCETTETNMTPHQIKSMWGSRQSRSNTAQAWCGRMQNR